MKITNWRTYVCAFAGGFAAVGAAAFLNGCSRGGGTLAVVNGEAITLNDFYKYLENKPDVIVVTENGTAKLSVSGSLGFQAAQDLIGNKVELQLAKDLGVYPTPGEIEHELQLKTKTDPNFVLNLSARGVTIPMIKESLALDLAQDKMYARGVKMTDQQVDDYIKTHPKQFMEPERVDLSVILVTDTTKRQKVDEELGSGQNFTQVALRYSEAPNARSYNGKLTDPDAGPPMVMQLPEPVQKIVQSTAELGTSEWTRFSNGWAKFYIHKKIAAKPMQLDASKKEVLKRFLMKQEGAKKNNVQKEVFDKLRNSKIEMVAESYRSQWKDTMENFKAGK